MLDAVWHMQLHTHTHTISNHLRSSACLCLSLPSFTCLYSYNVFRFRLLRVSNLHRLLLLLLLLLFLLLLLLLLSVINAGQRLSHWHHLNVNEPLNSAHPARISINNIIIYVFKYVYICILLSI